jgi:uncharacterized protein (DUF4213/DUF364 family)
MSIIDALISQLKFDASVRDIRQGPFQTAVITSNCGLASTPHNPGLHHDKPSVSEAGQLLHKETKALALLAKSHNQNEAAIGMATINSLLEVNEKQCVELNAANLLIQKGEEKRIAIIGHFPFIPRLQQAAKELWVIEKNAGEGDLPESAAEDLLPKADVVGITGTAFINHTIDHLLEICNPKAYTIMLGGTAPLSTILFEYGINAVSGTIVVEPEKVLRYVSQGATFRQITGIKLLTLKKD